MSLRSSRESNQEEEQLLTDVVSGLIDVGAKQMIQNIITALVLPHQIYKKIMTRTLRKTTYSAI